MTIFDQKTMQKYLPQLMLQQVLCSAVEKIINKALRLNINDNHALIALEQKTLAVKLSELGFPLCFSINNGTILVTKLLDRANCTITTSIQTLKTLQQEQQLTELIKQDKLDIVGEINVAQKFSQLAENLEIDWQSELAKHIGDVATHKLTQLGKSLLNKASFAAEQIQTDASEYLIHEKKLLVTNSQIQTFNQHVQHVSAQTAALSLRIDKLTSGLK